MRNALLALLAKESAHGYELKRALTDTFGELWPPINDGQIYTTLARLERDGLVRSEEVAQSAKPNKRTFQLTEAGREELHRWLDEPSPAGRVKDEFFTKLVLAARMSSGDVDPLTLIDRQRRAYLRRLRELHVAAARVEGNPAAVLALEGAALHLQADLKLLERCEEVFGGSGAAQVPFTAGGSWTEPL